MSDVVPISLNWDQFKGFVETYQLLITYAPTGPDYFLRSSNGQIDLQSFITDHTDVLDFETNFKAAAFEVAISPGPSLGAVTVTNFPSSQPVSGTVAATQSGAWNVGLTGSPSVAVTNFPATQPVSQGGAFNVSVTNFPATQPVSGTVSVANFPATQPISAASLPLPSGAATSANQSTEIASLGTIASSAVITLTDGQKTMAGSLPVTLASDQSTVTTSLGNSAGKTNVMKTGNLVTTAVTADQVVLTYTVTVGKTLYLEYLRVVGFPTVIPGNSAPVQLGATSLESPAGTKLFTDQLVFNTPLSSTQMTFTESVPIASGTVIRIVVTPIAATSFTWQANFGGFEK